MPKGGLSTVYGVTSVVQSWGPKEKGLPAWGELASDPACLCTPPQSWSASAKILPFHPADPDWASYKLGIFICLHCSGVHRNFPDVSKVKSVRLDFWDDSMVEVEPRSYADSWNWAWGEEAGRRCSSYSTEEEMEPREVQ